MGRDVVPCDMKPLVRGVCGVLIWVFSYVRDEEAAGSNPATPTQVTGWFRPWNRPSNGVPTLVVMTSPVSVQASPSAERRSACVQLGGVQADRIPGKAEHFALTET
jgi:hypothetical protein